MSIEGYLKHLGDKHQLRQWVEDLPEDTEAVILARKRAGDKDIYTHYSIGGMTLESANYMIDVYKKYLLAYAAED
jgi:hypothetical protein